MTAKLSLFMPYSQIAYQTEQLLYKKFFDLMHSLEPDEMIAFCPNDSLTYLGLFVVQIHSHKLHTSKQSNTRFNFFSGLTKLFGSLTLTFNSNESTVETPLKPPRNITILAYDIQEIKYPYNSNFLAVFNLADRQTDICGS